MSAPNTRVQSGPANDSKWAFRRHWTVDTTTGPVVGHAENGVTAFRGIPYAEPPVGNLRFRRARPITPWKEPFIAFHSGDECVQVKNPKQGVIGSENCLWLDVIVPTAGHPSATCSEAHSRPVVAFFHGGSNCFGSAANPQYSAQYLACSLDAVVVVVNYRIGLLGAMSLGYGDVPGGSSPDRFDTNIQLSDAILALHWIHDNATAFGGNPEKLTMMGQSSGGGIVTALTAVPGLDKIVSKVIAMSAAPATMVHHPSTSGEWANRLFELCKDPVSAGAQEIGRLTHKLNTLGNGFIKYFGPFSPVLDGDLLSRHPLDLSVANSGLISSGGTQPQSETKDVRNRNEEGDARTDVGGKIPLLIGTTKNEYYYLQLESVSTSTQRKRTKFFAESLSNEALDVLKESYRNVKSRRDIARFWGDSIFWAPSVRLAERWSPKNVWTYRLDTTTPFQRATAMGAIHTWDLPVLFGRYDVGIGSKALSFGGLQQVKATTENMQNRWRQFIHDGDPGFEPYGASRTTQVFDGDTEKLIEDPHRELREAWSKVNFDPQ